MATFKDAKDREWQINIDHRAIKACREIDVDIVSMEGIQKIAGDYLALCETAWVLCRKQSDERGINEEGFYEGLNGDALELAATAIVKAITDFFPQSRRNLLNKVMAKSRELEQKLMQQAEEELEKIV